MVRAEPVDRMQWWGVREEEPMHGHMRSKEWWVQMVQTVQIVRAVQMVRAVFSASANNTQCFCHRTIRGAVVTEQWHRESSEHQAAIRVIDLPPL
jgi:hypothetical protein